MIGEFKMHQVWSIYYVNLIKLFLVVITNGDYQDENEKEISFDYNCYSTFEYGGLGEQ